MKVFVLGSETVDLDRLLSNEDFQVMQLRTHFFPHPPVFVLAMNGNSLADFSHDVSGKI